MICVSKIDSQVFLYKDVVKLIALDLYCYLHGRKHRD